MSSKSCGEQRVTASGSAAVKTLVRNCRSTPAIPVTNCQPPSRPESAETKSKGNYNKGAEASSKDANLAQPQLLTTLKMKENLKKMNAGMKSVRFEQKLPPDTQSKVSRKVNIKFDEKIYRDLIDLKVTEDDLGLRPISSGKPKEVTRVREPVPELSDYYRPKFDKEYVVKPHPPTWPTSAVPCAPQRSPGATSSVLRAVKRWSVDDNKLI
uniref:Protein phosphatase 1 regulatory subunit 35 C-terminal domain-containing protein n=1 Tax=Lygus hesperus TaxID=30085 RepID=A0A146LJ04_LYGHE